MVENFEASAATAADATANASQSLSNESYKDSIAKNAPQTDSKTTDAQKADQVFGKVEIVDDSEKVKKGAESIHDAMNGMWRSDSDYEKVDKILQGMSIGERTTLKQEYKSKYNVDLDSEFKDHDKNAQQDKALNLLNKKDGSGDDACRIHTALIERGQWVEGRSDANCEKDIRDTLSTMNSEQIAQLDKDYCNRYGKHLQEALVDGNTLSAKSKDAVEIYLKGSDKRTDDDTARLTDTALKNKDIAMFGEAMRNASPEARKQFTDNGGEQKLKDAFEGHWYNAFAYVVPRGAATVNDNLSDKQLHRAEDLAKDGHMSTANKIRENTGAVSNTDKAIEQAINDMSPAERAAYSHGKELSKAASDQAALSATDKKALQTYNDIHKALIDTAPVDSYKVAKWEDMVEHKDGSLAGKIQSHKGHLYNDSASDTIKDIENMSKADWAHAKAHPEDRDQVLKSLQDLKGSSVSQDDIDKALKLYDQKINAKSYDDSQNLGHRALLDKLDGDEHWYKNDRKSMVEDITHMTAAEQARYKNDADYRKKLDDLITDKFGEGPALDAARHLLEKVRNGQKPEADLTVTMDMRAQEEKESKNLKTAGAVVAGTLLPGIGTALAAGAIADRGINDGGVQTATGDLLFGSHSANPVRDMQDEFQKHPELRQRILHPQTEEDKRVAADFEKAARQAMGDKDYEKYAKTLLETGHLPIDAQMQMDKGLITNDKAGSFKDVINASPEEKQKILQDKDYQEKALGFLSDDDRKVALAVLKQGKEEAEDTIRGKLNHWGGSDDIMQTLRDLKDKPGAIEQMKEEYARKYGHDLSADLIDKLSGADKLEAESLLKQQPSNAREAFNDARDQYYQSYDGVGKSFVNGVWDGTGHMTEDSMNEFAAKMEQYSAKFKELPAEQQKELSEKLNKSINLMVESKGAAAGAVVDTVIAAAAVGGAAFTDGVSLSLLAATGAGGAGLKVLVDSVMMGSDYDWSARGVSKDAAIGFVDGFVSMIGPGEVGSILKVGEVAAKSATEQVMKQGAEQLIKKGGEELIAREMQSAVKNAIVHGTYEVTDKALKQMVEQVAKTGATDAEKAALQQSLKTALQDNLSKESKSLLQKLANEYAFNMAGGALGGAGANSVGAAMEWDNSKSVGENMANIGKSAATGAVFGATGAAAFTTVFKVGGSVYHGLTESFHLKPGEQLSPEQLQKLAQETGLKDAKLHYDDHGNLVINGQSDRNILVLPEGNPHDTHVEEEAPATLRNPDEAPNTVRMPMEVSPQVKRVLDGADVPIEQRAALLDHIRQNQLAKPESIQDFLNDGRAMGAKWQDLSEVTARARSSEMDLNQARGRFFHEVHDALVEDLVKGGRTETDAIMLANSPIKLRELLSTDRSVAKFFQEHPDKLSILDQMRRGQEIQNVYNRTVMERTADLQNMMDKFNREHNLPHTDIVLVDGRQMNGANGYYQNGVIRLNADQVLAKKSMTDLLETVYHENVHSQQESLIARKVIDRFEDLKGSGYRTNNPPTRADVMALQAMYQNEGIGRISEQHLKDILSLRNGEKLSPEQASQAEALLSDWKTEGLGNYNQYNENVQRAYGKLSQLDTADGTKTIMNDLARDQTGAVRYTLFGDHPAFDIQKLVAAYEEGRISDKVAHDILQSSLRHNIAQMEVVKSALHSQYMRGIHETEAWVIGQSLQNQARGNGKPL